MKFLAGIILLSLVICVFSGDAYAQVAEQDSLALVALYNSTDGPNWSNNTNWITSGPVSEWYGVTVTGGHVIGLTLNTNQLTGSIPAEIGNLTHLAELILSFNQLSGSIPADIGNLTNLNALNLGVNQLTGSIPPELWNLTNLTTLSLSTNKLTGSIPAELGNLASLTVLGLSGNKLTGSIPAEIGNLTNLTKLWLSGNQLTGSIPAEIGNLTKLTELNLNYNQLTGSIPSEIGNLTNLTGLWLQANQLTGSIPAEIGNLIKLTELHLFTNQLTGSIPPEICNLISLTELYLYDNQLTGSIPPEISNLTYLAGLYFYDNQLTGPIPSEIGNLSDILYVFLENNQLTGPIPSEIGNLTKLNFLTLNGNQLTGSIPPEIGNLTNLFNLSLDNNQLSGSIPPEIGNLTKLQTLSLGNNQLAGSIPSEIGNLVKLTKLLLDSNQLTGSIPSEISNLTYLTDLYFNINQLTGSIPPAIGNLTKLRYFYLNDNELMDLSDLSSCTSLRELIIDNNRFTFEDIEPNIGVPITKFIYAPQDSVGGYQNITVSAGGSLTVSVTVGGEHNVYQWFKDGSLISGANDSTYTIDPVNIPDAGVYACEITNTVATELTLYRRPIHVTVLPGLSPAEQDSLALVALYNSTDGPNWTDNTNWLTSAPISEWYGVTVAEGRVIELNLGENNLKGSIPHELGNLNNLINLNLKGQIQGENQLSESQLTGNIPDEIWTMSKLETLDLSINQLTGTIPPEISNLVNLVHLNLCINQLNGTITPAIGNLTNLEFLLLYSNQLTGTIPSEIGNLIHLCSLHLDFNQLTGTIPSEIGNLNNLVILYLNNNQLTGTIPSEINDLIYLITLNLSENQLSGSIPLNNTNLNYMRWLYLNNNQFTDLPVLSTLISLERLTIQNNKFTFEDIEPNIGVPSTTFTYAPQDNVGEYQDITLNQGETLTVSITVGGEHNVYQWFKDGSQITGANDSTYTIGAVSLADAGVYTCEITNTVATALTLYSRPITVEVPYVGEWQMSYGTGWDMVSLGLDVEDKTLSSVFPPAISLYKFDNGYQQANELEIGKGYWVNLSSGINETVYGDGINELNLNLPEKWSMVGTVSSSVAASDIIQNPPDTIISIYGYNGTYYIKVYPGGSEFLEQGHGYWINMASAGTINMESSSGPGKVLAVKQYTHELLPWCIEIPLTVSCSSGEKTLSLYMTDQPAEMHAMNRTFEMPPVPPFGSFDVRIASYNTNGLQNMIIDATEDFETAINIMVPEGNNTTVISWVNNGLPADTYFLSDGATTVDMASVNRFEITGSGKQLSFMQKIGIQNQEPIAYSLSTNYPNPFNPETTIPYTIKESGMVELTVFNALGQEVRRLVYELKEPGMHKAVWNGTDMFGQEVSGGIYLYRLRVNDFIETKKMLFMK